MTELKFNRFDISKMKNDSIVLIVAKRRTGKSYLCRDILYHKKFIPVGIVISPTEKANSFYSDFIPDLFIHDAYEADIIENLLCGLTKIPIY